MKGWAPKFWTADALEEGEAPRSAGCWSGGGATAVPPRWGTSDVNQGEAPRAYTVEGRHPLPPPGGTMKGGEGPRPKGFCPGGGGGALGAPMIVGGR